MDDVQVHTGIVGFFDILGYQSVLENNSARYVAATVFRTILKMKMESEVEVKRLFRSLGSSDLRVDWRGELQKINWLELSDTIVMLLPYRNDPGRKEDLRTLHWALFLVSSIVLYRTMFEHGLPLRGAIAFGEFAVAGRCFAGKPIVEAYKVGHDLNLSAIVLTIGAQTEAQKIPNVKRLLEVTTFDFLVPRKILQPNKIMTLYPTFSQNPYQGDIRQLIVDSFSKHGKDIGPDVVPKVENTDLFFRTAKTHNPEMFRNRDEH